MIRVAVDAMGGDRAPETEVAGAVQALAALPEDVAIQLVGRPAAIEAEPFQRPPTSSRSSGVQVPDPPRYRTSTRSTVSPSPASTSVVKVTVVPSVLSALTLRNSGSA